MRVIETWATQTYNAVQTKILVSLSLDATGFSTVESQCHYSLAILQQCLWWIIVICVADVMHLFADYSHIVSSSLGFFDSHTIVFPLSLLCLFWSVFNFLPELCDHTTTGLMPGVNVFRMLLNVIWAKYFHILSQNRNWRTACGVHMHYTVHQHMKTESHNNVLWVRHMCVAAWEHQNVSLQHLWLCEEMQYLYLS